MENEATRHLRNIDRTLRAVALLGGLLLVVWLLRDILLLVFTAVLFACVLKGAGDLVRRMTGMGSATSVMIVFVGALVLIGLLLWWRGAAIADQSLEMADQLRTQAQNVWRNLNNTAAGAFVAEQLQSAKDSIVNGAGGYVPGVAGSVLGFGGSLVVVTATALFLALSPQTYVRGSLRMLPVAWRARGHAVADEIGGTLQLWFLGQVIDMVIVTVLVGLGLFLLGVPLAGTLALFAGLLNFVPYIGALAGAVPALLVAFSQSPTLAIWVAVLFLVIQMTEGNLIAPLIQKRTISLPPALTILSQTILGTLFGIFGLIIATPLMAALQVAVRMIYVEDVLEGGDATQSHEQG